MKFSLEKQESYSVRVHLTAKGICGLNYNKTFYPYGIKDCIQKQTTVVITLSKPQRYSKTKQNKLNIEMYGNSDFTET